MKQKVIVICGPTATGKSDLAIKLAAQFNGEVISADSRQVYKGLNIGTGKVTKKEMAGIKHYLLDVASPRTKFSVIKYVKHADKAIKQIIKNGKTPIICGGTGFYIQALIDRVVFPEVPPNEKLREQLNHFSQSELLAQLQKLDPQRFKTIEKDNIRRVIRAIEIATALGKVPTLKKTDSPFDVLFIGLTLPTNELRERISLRLNKRLKAGMLKEAINLHKRGLSWKRMIELGLEYKYMALYLQGRMTRRDLVEKLGVEIYRYAKRQMTWFKRDSRIQWLSPREFKEAVNLTAKFLQKKKPRA